MSIKMIPVQSSNVQAIGLDGARILVQFANGVYECVRSDGSEANAAVAFERFLSAESKGKFYNETIRRAVGVWNVRKLEDALAAQLAPKAEEQALAQAIEGAKAVKGVERLQKAAKWDDPVPIQTPRSLTQTIKDMLEVVPESETALRERLTEIQSGVMNIEGTAWDGSEWWSATSGALALHVGDPEKLEESDAPVAMWKLDVWQIFRGYGATAQQNQGKPARHKFAVDMSKAGQGADSCLECPYPRKHPVHDLSVYTSEVQESITAKQLNNLNAGQGDAREDPHVFVLDLTRGGEHADICLKCGLPLKHPVHEANAEAVKRAQAQKRGVGTRTLLLTVGLPRSGKTTFARKTGFPIVSPDAIRLALHGKAFEQLAEPFVWAQARLMVRALFLAGHETVVLDACSVTRARRDEWRGSEWETFCVLIDTPLEECLKRAEPGEWQDVNGKRVRIPKLTPVIRAMAVNFEPLGKDEQVWAGAPLLFNVGELKGIPTYPLSEGRELIPRSPYAGYNLPILVLDHKMPDPEDAPPSEKE